jgi:DivIVA domain-containing protein
MSDELTPGLVRARRFDLARKGYDRNQVEAFLDDLASELESLESEVGLLRSQDPALGIDDREALGRELHRIGDEVASILEAAREAAEGIRSRASQDAERLRAETDDETLSQLEAATEQSQAMRAAAWKEGSAMLASATSEAQAMIAAAKEETLFVRAEAEREALRLTGDARRDREETIRAARVEAEQLLETARQESDGVLAAASQQAEMAQERARALEARRTELLGELETARAAIGELESEIESRRQELETPEVPQADLPETTHHTDDGGSVRIVSPTRVVPLGPVDAEELVAEVTALRSGLTAVPPVVPSPSVVVIPGAEPADAAKAADVTDTVEATPPDSGAPDLPGGERPTPDATPQPDSAETTGELDALADDDLAAAEPTDDERAEALIAGHDETDTPGEETDHAATHAGDGDAIGSLFARLRESPTVPEPSSPSRGATQEDGASDDPADAPVGVPGTADDQREAPAGRESEPANEIAAAGPSGDATDLTDAALIPVQNEALRSIKRSLVELQNETLEHLRTDSAWLPAEGFTDRFREPFADLSAAIGSHRDPSEGAAFGTDLLDAVTSAIGRARASGGGDREVAAAASKVFRSWRSDEAERRVVAAARSLAGV